MDLMAGPRGRRLLLAFAIASERSLRGDVAGLPLGTAVFEASLRLATEHGHAVTRFGWGKPPARPDYTPADVAARLAETELAPVTADVILGALQESTASAMYWQEPDGDDLLCAMPQVRAALARVAEHLVASPAVHGWAAPVDPTDQWLLEYDADGPPQAWQDLSQWRADIEAQELAAGRDRPADPRANWTGAWWSHPPHRPTSTSSLPNGSPAGLWLVEDSLGWDIATAYRLEVDPSSRIYEIDGAAAWATLCQEAPLEVTATKRHDWYRTTGRAGRWLIPDWSLVARHYDGVHLSIGGYLSAATTAIEVGDGATVIAGWSPDTTWWLNDTVRRGGEPTRWRRSLDEHGEGRWSATS